MHLLKSHKKFTLALKLKGISNNHGHGANVLKYIMLSFCDSLCYLLTPSYVPSWTIIAESVRRYKTKYDCPHDFISTAREKPSSLKCIASSITS